MPKRRTGLEVILSVLILLKRSASFLPVSTMQMFSHRVVYTVYVSNRYARESITDVEGSCLSVG